MPQNPKSLDVTVVLPGLMLIEQEAFRPFVAQAVKQGARLPALELILSRGRLYNGNDAAFESVLFGLFGLSDNNDKDVPMAALNWLLYHGEISSHWMMRADPVLVQPNRDHLMMMGNDVLDISDDEAQQIVDDINATYSDTPWQLHALSAMHWVIQCPEPQALTTYPLASVLGKNISHYLPQGDDAAPWHALMNEMQMLLYTHPVNREREAKGSPAINSVWLWGSGRLPAADDKQQNISFVQCWSNNPLAQSLARLQNVPRVDLPSDGETWLKQVVTGGRHLLVIDDLNIPATVLQPYDWWQDLVRINNQWLQPLVDALKTGDIDRLEIVTDGGRRCELTAALAKRWWKRIQSLDKN